MIEYDNITKCFTKIYDGNAARNTDCVITAHYERKTAVDDDRFWLTGAVETNQIKSNEYSFLPSRT